MTTTTNPEIEATPQKAAIAFVAGFARPSAAVEASAPAIASPVPIVARFLPSLTDIAFLMPVFFLFFKLDGARTLLGDGDTGWHIRTGEWILANGKVPHADMFSFTRPGAEWFAWEWLWDLAFAVLNGTWGMGAVVFANIVLICITSAMLFRLIRRRCENGLVAIAMTLLATGGCAIHWLARPHLFTLLFFVLTLHITERARAGNTRMLIWLLPLTALWVNLHGGFFVVFLILATYVGGIALQALIEPALSGESLRDRTLRCLRELRPWLLTSAACFAMTFLNPYGWKLHQHMAAYLTDPYNLKYITEFQGMNFHSAVVPYFEPLMVGSLFACVWYLRQRRFQEVLLTLGWLQLALVAQRNIPLFSLAVAPFMAEAITASLVAGRASGLNRWIRGGSEKLLAFATSVDDTDHIRRVHLASALPLLVVGLLLLLPNPVHAKFTSTYDPAFYPEKALPLMLSPETHYIFTDDEWGDYLVYKLYPSRKVFVDGRSDFYGDEFCEKYQELLTVSSGFEKILDHYRIDTILLSPRFALSSALKLSPVWKVVYDDHVSLVFRRVSSLPGAPVSVISSDGGISRDRVIAKNKNRDPFDHSTQYPKTQEERTTK